jgi:hypothetical protein
VGPKAVIEGEIMLLFVLTPVLEYDGGVISHLYACDATKKFLSLIERTNSYGNFDAHYCKVRILSLYLLDKPKSEIY